MEETVRRLALRLKMHDVSGSVVHHVALLKKALDQQGIPCEMIKGYCIIEETKESCEHYWVRVPTDDPSLPLDLDIGFEVAKLRSPDLQTLHPILLESMLPGMTRSDEREFQIRHENERLFELFQRDPKAFWREAPRDVRDFRMTTH